MGTSRRGTTKYLLIVAATGGKVIGDAGFGQRDTWISVD